MIKRECFDKKLRKYSIIFFVNARLKLASKIPVSNPYFKQYVLYEVPNRKRKELCNEERKNVFCSLKCV